MNLGHLVRVLVASAIALVSIATLGGCATHRVPQAEVQAYLADKPAPLAPLYEKAIVQGPRHWVLNHMHAGLAAMEAGEFAAAQSSFDEALTGIETVYAETESADAALRAWRSEGSKDFKGEPYERAMAYYYRGLLFLEEGDYENARASFKRGAQQDSIAENAEYEEDFALMHYLEGWASQCNGDLDMADEAFAVALQQRPGLRRPARGEDVLVVAETGRGPLKVADGPDGSWLRFQGGEGTSDQAVRVSAGARPVDAFAIEDLYFQASTRGSRPVEAILEGKAHFKEDMETVGKGAMAAGLAVMASSGGNSDAAMVGAGLMAAGLIIDLGSNLVKPGADTRTWGSLPGKVHVATLSDSNAPLAVEFLDELGQPVEGMAEAGRLRAGAGECRLVWTRSGSADGSLVARRPLGLEVASSR